MTAHSNMKIELSLLSVISMAYLILFGMASTEMSLDSIEISASISSDECVATVHPVWRIWVPEEVAFNRGCNALAYGNVIVVGEHMRGGTFEEYVLNHERMHIQQFRALGFLTWPAQFIIDIEPDKSITTNWNDPTQPGRTMWAPPDWWKNQWSFMTITIDRRQG